MTGPELRAALAGLAARHGWPRSGQAEFSRLAAVELRRLRKWIHGEHPVGGDAACLVLALQRDPRLVDALRAEYQPSALPVSGPLDRLLWAQARDPALARALRERAA